MINEMIPLITYILEDDESSSSGKGLLGEAIAGKPAAPDSSKGIGRVEVSADVIEEQMTKLLKGVGGMLSRAKQSAGEVAGMELQEVELSVSISAEGQVSLLGIGGTQAGVEGAITLKFGKPN